MKKGLSMFLSVLMVLSILTSMPLNVNAASVDDLTFELNDDGKSYSVTDCDTTAEGELVIPDTYNGLPVTAIEDYAFDWCDTITNVIISTNIKQIGDSSFRYCYGLISVIIPEGVVTIGECAFQECQNLEMVSIPTTLKKIGYAAFEYCRALETVYIKDIGSYCNIDLDTNFLFFYGAKLCLNGEILEHLTIPNCITEICETAFYGCSSLVTVTIPNSVNNIGANAFADCEQLTKITLPDNIEIGMHAFYNTGFYDNEKNWKNGILYIDNYLIAANSNLITSEYSIEKEIKAIGGGAFFGCENITEIVIPDSVISIGERAFLGCTKLSKVSFGNNVYSIGEYAFGACLDLKNITLPPNVNKIDEFAFGYVIEGGVYKIKNFMIFGDKNSAAEIYAKENGFEFVDLNHTHTPSSWITDKKATVNAKVNYTDKKAKKGKTYTYKIRAYKSKTYSAYSNAKKIKDKY